MMQLVQKGVSALTLVTMSLMAATTIDEDNSICHDVPDTVGERGIDGDDSDGCD